MKPLETLIDELQELRGVGRGDGDQTLFELLDLAADTVCATLIACSTASS